MKLAKWMSSLVCSADGFHKQNEMKYFWDNRVILIHETSLSFKNQVHLIVNILTNQWSIHEAIVSHGHRL